MTDQPGIIWPKDRTVRTDDGADLAYTFLGPDDGPVVALCSGLLCPDTWWHYLAPELVREGYRVLVFHYRGIATSGLPEHDHDDAYTLERYAADLATILDHEHIEEVACVGHSMGTQVALEAYRLLGDRVTAIALITGGFESPLRTLYDREELVAFVYWPLRLTLRFMAPPVRRLVWQQAWTKLPFLTIGRAIKAFGPRSNEKIIRSYVEHAASLDPSYVLNVFAGLHAHSAADLLPQVKAPTLVIGGAKDPFSPPSQDRLMVGQLPNAVLRTIPNGTHGAVLEYPELVNGWVLDFLGAHLDERLAEAGA